MYNHPGHSLLNWPKTSTPSTNFCSFALRFLRKMVIPKAHLSHLLITIRTSQITQGVWEHLYFQVVYTSFPIFSLKVSDDIANARLFLYQPRLWRGCGVVKHGKIIIQPSAPSLPGSV